MTKRIALIMERADITLGGAEQSIFNLRDALVEIGLDATIIAAKKATDYPYVHALYKNKRWLHVFSRVFYWNFARKLNKYFKEHQYDIIHSVLPFEFAHIYQPRGGTYPETISRNATSYQNELISSYKQITAFTNLHRRAYSIAEKKICANRKGPLIVSISNYVTRQFKKHYHLGDERIIQIYNGIETNKLAEKQQANKLLTRVLEQLHLKESDDRVLFLFAATNPRLKGLKPLIESLNLACSEEAGKNIYLVVAGIKKKKKEKHFRQITRRFGIEHKVAFIGYVPCIQNAFSITDVAVLPTFYDPASRFILEAIVDEKPVITTKYNGASELIIDGRHGKIIDEPDNTNMLAKTLIHFADRNNIRKTKDAILTDKLKEKVSIRNVASALDQLYEKIMNGETNLTDSRDRGNDKILKYS